MRRFSMITVIAGVQLTMLCMVPAAMAWNETWNIKLQYTNSFHGSWTVPSGEPVLPLSAWDLEVLESRLAVALVNSPMGAGLV